MEMAGEGVVREAEAALKQERLKEMEIKTGSEFEPKGASAALAKELRRAERKRDEAEEKEKHAREELEKQIGKFKEKEEKVKRLTESLKEEKEENKDLQEEVRLVRNSFKILQATLCVTQKERDDLKQALWEEQKKSTELQKKSTELQKKSTELDKSLGEERERSSKASKMREDAQREQTRSQRLAKAACEEKRKTEEERDKLKVQLAKLTAKFAFSAVATGRVTVDSDGTHVEERGRGEAKEHLRGGTTEVGFTNGNSLDGQGHHKQARKHLHEGQEGETRSEGGEPEEGLPFCVPDDLNFSINDPTRKVITGMQSKSNVSLGSAISHTSTELSTEPHTQQISNPFLRQGGEKSKRDRAATNPTDTKSSSSTSQSSIDTAQHTIKSKYEGFPTSAFLHVPPPPKSHHNRPASSGSNSSFSNTSGGGGGGPSISTLSSSLHPLRALNSATAWTSQTASLPSSSFVKGYDALGGIKTFPKAMLSFATSRNSGGNNSGGVSLGLPAASKKRTREDALATRNPNSTGGTVGAKQQVKLPSWTQKRSDGAAVICVSDDETF